MAVNRVVQQHFSMKLDYLEKPTVYQNHKNGEKQMKSCASEKMFGLSPPSESNLMQRRIRTESCQFLLPKPTTAIPSPSG